jgi:hypothetical protein
MKKGSIVRELFGHMPFTVGASILAILIVGMGHLFSYGTSFFGSFFYVLHPAHIFVSAIASAAIFYKHRENIFYGLLIGIFGALLIGTISDVILPFIGGSILDIEIRFHLPVFERPLLILGIALIGSFIGIYTKISKLPHFIHVFLSVFASLFYLLTFGEVSNLINLILAFVVVVLAVLFSCCFSDIIFPLFFVGVKK